MNWWLQKAPGKMFPPSGFRKWARGIRVDFHPHKDTWKKLQEIQSATNQTMAAIVRILIDKSLGLESDPRDLISDRDLYPRNIKSPREKKSDDVA
jgi:hypothetical protein